MSEWAEKSGKLADEQNGFRPERSTVDSAFIFNELIALRQARGLPTYVSFLDIKKAYDTTWHAGLIAKMGRIGNQGKVP